MSCVFLATNTGSSILPTQTMHYSIKRQIKSLKKKLATFASSLIRPPLWIPHRICVHIMTHNDASTAKGNNELCGASWNPNEFFDSSLGTLNSEPKRFDWVIHIHDAMGEVWRKFGFSTLLLVPYLEKMTNICKYIKYGNVSEIRVFWKCSMHRFSERA